MTTRITADRKPRAAVGWEEAVVLRLREGARGGGKRRHQEVRELSADGANLRSAVGGEEAVVCWLRKGARGGGEHFHQNV